MRIILFPIAVAVIFAPFLSSATHPDKKITDRLAESATVLSEIMSSPDKGIPEDLLNKAHCAIVVPGLKKGAFIVGWSI